MELGINDILLHYEELGDFDYKINITLFLVAKYIQAFTGTTEFYARKRALEMMDPLLGWAQVMDSDERFYNWCKKRFFNKAMSKRSKTKNYTLFWLEDGKVRRRDYITKDSAFGSYNTKQSFGWPLLLFIRQANGQLRSAPIRRHDAKALAEKVGVLLIEEHDRVAASEAVRCQKTRQVRSCADCLRYNFCETAVKEKGKTNGKAN